VINATAFRRTSRTRGIRALVSAVIAEFRPSVVQPTTQAPVQAEADETAFFTEADMPPAEAIAEAARLFFRAADEARTADRAKRKARKLLDRLASGVYAGWELERVESSRQTVDLDAVRKIFREHGLGPVPMKASTPSLRVSRVEAPVASAVEVPVAALVGA
jgi:hypothetical protein